MGKGKSVNVSKFRDGSLKTIWLMKPEQTKDLKIFIVHIKWQLGLFQGHSWRG